MAGGLKSFHLFVMFGVCRKHGVIALLSYTECEVPVAFTFNTNICLTLYSSGPVPLL